MRTAMLLVLAILLAGCGSSLDRPAATREGGPVRGLTVGGSVGGFLGQAR